MNVPRRPLTVGLLGPMEVSVGDRPVVITTGRLRALLAVLAMDAARVVPASRVVAALWGEALPNDARRSLRTYATRLRDVLGPASITSQPEGYTLHADRDGVDALRFVRLLDAVPRGDRAGERRLLGTALRLWRGEPLVDVPSPWLQDMEAPRLVERYLAAVERRIDLDRDAGGGDDLIAELVDLTARYPLRESLWARLLTLLQRRGRLAEALDRYEAIRVRLADQLGADPGPPLQHIYAELLAGRVSVEPPSAPARVDDLVPRQLPADLDSFVGRREHLDELGALLPGAGGNGRAAKVVVVIHGAAGIGKTALAVRWAHGVCHRFVDGQLYVNLRGYDPSGSPLDPAEAVRGFLNALGVPPQAMPADPQAQVGLYRSLLADRQVLVVADNARDAEQVRPLLPGSSTCLVVVTSRNPLAGLVATGDAKPIGLDLLTRDESRQLLARRLGDARLAREPRPVDAIIDRCARLPLALAIVAAAAAVDGDLTLTEVAGRLRRGAGDLAAFPADDALTDVRAVFSWSHRSLGADAARLYRLLSLHAGPDIAAPAAASLAAVPPAVADRILTDLAEAHLVEATRGRYSFHDLLRAHASELARAHESDADRRSAIHRGLDHYVHTADAAATMLYPQQRYSLDVGPIQPAVAPETFSGVGQALDWYAAELPVLLAAVGRAATLGFDCHAWHLARALVEYLDRRGRWHDIVSTQRIALDAAGRLRDTARRAESHRSIARAHAKLGRYDEADGHLRAALDIYQDSGCVALQAHVHRNLGWLCELRGDDAEALRQSRHALQLYEAAGDRLGQARASNAVGWYHALLGQYQSALDHCGRALEAHRDIGNRFGQASSLDSLGYVYHHLGHHRQALSSYRQALAVYRDIGERHGEAETLSHLGDAYDAMADVAAARTAWRQALAIFDDLAHLDADRVRAKLADR